MVPGILCTQDPGGNIYLCGLAQGSSEWRRGNVTRWDRSGGGQGNVLRTCTCLQVWAAAPRREEWVWRKRGKGGGRFGPGSLERFAPDKSTGSGITILSVNLGVAQCAPAFSEPLLPNVGNGGQNPGKVQRLSAIIHANTCLMPCTQCLILPYSILFNIIIVMSGYWF